MKILMLFSYAPLPPPLDLGGTKRNRPFLLELLKQHSVTVLSYGSPEDERIFRESVGNACDNIVFVDRRRPRILNGLQRYWLLLTGRSHFRQIYRPEMQQAIDKLVANERFDLIHCVTQFFGYFRFPSDIPVTSDSHEVSYDLIYRTFKKTRSLSGKIISYLMYKLGKPEEIRVCRTFDGLIATTERDKGVFQEVLPDQKLYAIGNGVDPAFLEYPSAPIEPHSVVFTGKMDFYPNIHGILTFLDKVFPLILQKVPDAKVYVVGAYPTREVMRRAAENVIVTGFVDDVRPYMARGELYIIPLWIGGGIRGKALEAMAMRKPIVTTSIGCESIKLTHNESALFSDTPEGFADAILRLFADKNLQQTLARNAHSNVLAYYDWKVQGKALSQVFAEYVPAVPRTTPFRTSSARIHAKSN
jgi:glycosyltransferase involved in cell wall biosynthesis